MCKKLGKMMKKSVLFTVLFWIVVAVSALAIVFQMVDAFIIMARHGVLEGLYRLFVQCGQMFFWGITALGIIILCGAKLLLSDETEVTKKTDDFNDRIEQLKKINKLRESGAISEEEFELQKKIILG